MNPFKILKIGPGASKQDIIRAAALAMREKEHSGRDVALAQKCLMDPVSGITCEFKYLIDTKPLRDSLDPAPPETADTPDIEYHTFPEDEKS